MENKGGMQREEEGDEKDGIITVMMIKKSKRILPSRASRYDL